MVSFTLMCCCIMEALGGQEDIEQAGQLRDELERDCKILYSLMPDI